MIRILYLLFILSGAAGLIYESIWTRYLGLFVGHDAYAQILVLVIFLGGMSVGAMAVSRRSERLRQPLRGYVIVEFAVGCIGLLFHDLFQWVTGMAYGSIFPALAGSVALPIAKWALASALILPQSVLLGTTFPLMSAGVLRLRPTQPGRSLSLLYFSNSLGAAVGVLVAGFYLVSLAGLPGTLLVAAMLNLVVAVATIGVIGMARRRQAGEPAATAEAQAALPCPTAHETSPLERLLLATAFGTAVASFIYEIDWIRMLSLVLGSATHSFELMLSAFILGLALGSFWIRRRADAFGNPVRALGVVQWVMGSLALATLPLYSASFGWVASLLATFARNDLGYTGFTLARYAICLAIMLPATFCAGMTLPLLTRTLVASGSGERAIGAVYGWNTLGSIVGVMVGGLVLLPLLGLKGMLLAGAGLDMAIGLVLLTSSSQHRGAGLRLAYAGGAATILILVVAGTGVRLDRQLLTSGVYRTGTIPDKGQLETPFYQDGKTATVSTARSKRSGQIFLATNGKTDASLGPTWLKTCDSVSHPTALSGDAATQALLPLVTLAHVPAARTAAVIGHGSGMSTHFLLGGPNMARVVTVEIEPQMVAGARVFYPANRRAFDDPRSELVIDDAKSYFASAHQQYDLILSEPSNPWVSGVSGLFTTEFYGRVRQYLSEEGVFGQWLHTYELDDGLVLSVLAAIHQNFRSYEVFLVSGGDLLVVAGNRARLPEPDWSVFGSPGVRQDLCRFLPLTVDALNGLRLIGRAGLAPLLDSFGQANSDYYPVLDLGAEQRRYRRDYAAGFYALSSEWFNLLSSVAGRRSRPADDPIAGLPETPRVRARALEAYLRGVPSSAGADTTLDTRTREASFALHQWRASLATDRPPTDWPLWAQQMLVVDRYRSGGMAGTVDNATFVEAAGFLRRHGAPEPVRDVLSFRHGMQSWNFDEAARAADRLLPIAMRDHDWITADELRDGAVVANLHVGNVGAARQVLDTLARFSTRRPGDVRSQLLEAYVRQAEEAGARAGRGALRAPVPTRALPAPPPRVVHDVATGTVQLAPAANPMLVKAPVP